MRIRVISTVLGALIITAALKGGELDSSTVLELQYIPGSSFLKTAAVDADQFTSLWDEDALSSGWLLGFNGKANLPAEDGWKRVEQRTERGGKLRYSIPDFILDQELILSTGRRHALLKVRFTNNRRRRIKLRPILILDTNLGEYTGVPFVLSDGSAVISETVRVEQDVPQWIKSEYTPSGPSLVLSFDGITADRPQRLVMANWMRLKENELDIAVQEGRSFDYPPFSEDDRAVLIQYAEQRLPPGKSMELNLVFGLDEYEAGRVSFEAAPPPPEPEPAPEPEPEPEPEPAPPAPAPVYLPPPPPPKETLSEESLLRIAALRALLRKLNADTTSIDSLLENQNAVDRAAVEEAESKVNIHEKLRAEYERNE